MENRILPEVGKVHLDGNFYTIFAVDVANSNSASGGSYFIGSSYNGVDSTLHMGYRTANDFTFAQYADDLDWVPAADFTFAIPRLWTGHLDDTGKQEIFLDGITRASRGANDYPGTLINGTVGMGNGGAYKGDLAEIVVYNRGLTDTERTTVEGYLTHKWLSNSRGLTAPFSVGASNPVLAIDQGASGHVAITLTGAPNTSYRLLATTNLTLPVSSWLPIATNTTSGGGLWQLTDTNTNKPGRYYRAVTP